MVNRIGIVGAGLMGRQLGKLFAEEGYAVSIYDKNANSIRLAKQSFLTASQRTTTPVEIHASLSACVEHADIVIEAVAESLAVKRSVLSQISEMNDKAIIASNASVIPTSWVTDSIIGNERLLNVHFYNRPHERRVAEVMSCGFTSIGTFETVDEWLRRSNFRVFRLQRESVGFLYNRIWAAVKRESLKMIDEGISTPQEIDEIYRAIEPSPPKGPFERMDSTGLDTVAAVEQIYQRDTPEDLPEALTHRVRSGHLGVKTGRGFFHHSDH